MRDIEILLSDGFIGNKAVLVALSSLTTGNLNAKLKQGAATFKMKDVLPSTHEYIIPPLTPEEQKAEANRQLLAFMSQAPGSGKYFDVHPQ